MKLLLCVVLFISVSAQAQTTFILIRHAEKVADGSKDPGLTDAGKQRALKLTAMFQSTKVDAIYSTNYNRTKSTVEPLAAAKGLAVQSYEPNNGAEMDKIFAKYPGGIIIICGHSNTTPWTANYLLGNNELKDFGDGDYDNVLMVEVMEKGKGKMIWMKY